MKFCCEQFIEKSQGSKILSEQIPYPPIEVRLNAQFEPSEDGETWVINGCCGGQCAVVVNMRFCPYCGAKLDYPK